MDQRIIDVFMRILNIDLVQIVYSNSSDKEICQKIKVRPLLIKDNLVYQASEYRGTKVFHQNLNADTILEYLTKDSEKDVTFGQIVVETKAETITILVSKKGKVTIKSKKVNGQAKKSNLEHNRSKQYILPEGTQVPFLVDLGVMTKEGKIVQSKYDKYRQINRFLEFIEDVLPSLPKDEPVTILDFGCGKSYLTFAMYYYLKVLKGYEIKIVGLDLKKDVIETCNNLAKKYGYEEMQFLEGDIASYSGVDKIDMVVTLHACDTATDYALYKAICWNAKVILSVPCCQHELNKQMKNTPLEQLFQYGLIKERSAALFTDAIRANLLEQWGYKTQILEFIDMSHTPKNILIRAVKDQTKPKTQHKKITKKGQSELTYNQILEYFNIHPTLDRLLKEHAETLEK
ncbi:MAG: SAM-dependent methyltransferase [bacterium]|nr:SAM-dependent methyltransferase [bacterium]